MIWRSGGRRGGGTSREEGAKRQPLGWSKTLALGRRQWTPEAGRASCPSAAKDSRNCALEASTKEGATHDTRTRVTGKGYRTRKAALATKRVNQTGLEPGPLRRGSHEHPGHYYKGSSQTSQPRPRNHRLLFLIIYGSQIAVSVIRTIIWFNNSANRIIV